MRARFPIASVILIASISCAGGPTSDFPAEDTPNTFRDAGTGGSSPGDNDEDAASDLADAGEAPSMDASTPVTASPPCLGDASADGGSDADASDAAVSDGGTGDASDAASDVVDAASDAGDAAQIEAGANFPDAANDAQPAPDDASSDAPYTLPDATPCVP